MSDPSIVIPSKARQLHLFKLYLLMLTIFACDSQTLSTALCYLLLTPRQMSSAAGCYGRRCVFVYAVSPSDRARCSLQYCMGLLDHGSVTDFYDRDRGKGFRRDVVGVRNRERAIQGGSRDTGINVKTQFVEAS